MKKESILQMGSDKMLLKHVYDRPFTIRLPDRSEWKEGFQPDTKWGLIWYKDGSKTNKGTGAGVYCDGTGWKRSFGLGQYTTVFQAEVPLRHMHFRILIGTIEIGTSISYQTGKLQLKHLVHTKSLQNWFGTATNPSYNWPDITEYN